MGSVPFELRVDERSDQDGCVHRNNRVDTGRETGGASAKPSSAFPPHWAGTEIRWQLAAAEGGTTVSFRHTDGLKTSVDPGVDEPGEASGARCVAGIAQHAFLRPHGSANLPVL